MTTEYVFYAHNGRGPVHLSQDDEGRLSWCGAKAQFRHISRPGDRAEVTCKRCLRQIAQDRPLAWGGS